MLVLVNATKISHRLVRALAGQQPTLPKNGISWNLEFIQFLKYTKIIYLDLVFCAHLLEDGTKICPKCGHLCNCLKNYSSNESPRSRGEGVVWRKYCLWQPLLRHCVPATLWCFAPRVHTIALWAASAGGTQSPLEGKPRDKTKPGKKIIKIF